MKKHRQLVKGLSDVSMWRSGRFPKAVDTATLVEAQEERRGSRADEARVAVRDEAGQS